VKRLLLPVAAVQGKWMRATIRPAPPATGPTSGTVETTSGAPLRIAVVGESTRRLGGQELPPGRRRPARRGTQPGSSWP
jgi:hypothetical protein